jgi:hypothetical protein
MATRRTGAAALDTELQPLQRSSGDSNGGSVGATQSEQQLAKLPAPDIRFFRLRVRGTSPLICHNWSEKARKEMRDKQQRKAKVAKEAKDPERDYRESLYYLPEHTADDPAYGFPCIGFKAAMVRAGTYQDLKMTFLRGAFHVIGELVRIEGEPRMREDMVRVGMGVADIRYRGEFPQWETWLPIRYNARVISAEQIANLAQEAGFAVGVGEWRPERDGSFGTFEVAGDGE